MRVAVDLLGGDFAPDAVAEGLRLVADESPEIAITVVGPADTAERLLGRDRFEVVPASQAVEMGEDPARAVRAKRDATVRVACRLVRDGEADAAVSVGSTGAMMAAALFTLGRLPGCTRPALAVTVPAAAGPVVLLDAGANVAASPDLLVQFALAGSAYARARYGLDAPRVGLLNVGSEPGKGDAVRTEAWDLLADAPIAFVGNVEGADLALGEAADVIVTDGFTGNVALKSMEGLLALARREVQTHGDGYATEGLDALAPERQGGAVLLGVKGVAVIGHGASAPRAVASCVALAAKVADEDLVTRVGDAMAELVARRRSAAGLPEKVPS